MMRYRSTPFVCGFGSKSMCYLCLTITGVCWGMADPHIPSAHVPVLNLEKEEGTDDLNRKNSCVAKIALVLPWASL